MKNKSVYNKLQIQVDNILEVRLPFRIWNKIKWVAANKRRSYSWVVRYAVFRMLKRQNIQRFSGDGVSGKLSKKIAKLNELVKAERIDSKKKHRHRLCLYGKDELFIRLSAAKLECTMTHLIRLALALYLDDLARKFPLFRRANDSNGRFSRAAWRCLGIKVLKGVKFPTLPISRQHFEFNHYLSSDYW